MNLVRFAVLALLLTFLVGTFSSCSVFEAIGDSLSQLYDNSVSYFNAYYNAQQIFEEAENAVNTSQRDVDAKAILTQKPAAPAVVPREKFNSVIDKCSSILTFYPKSAVADDAVLLIGKSYYYQQEYLKAERKFTELLTQYPNSSLVLECQLWFAKTLERLRKQEEAEIAAKQVAQDAGEANDSKIAEEAFMLLGSLAEQENNLEDALQYYTQSLSHTSDGYGVAKLWAKIGDLHFALKDYEKANHAYNNVHEDGVPDISLDFYGRIQAVRGYKALKLFDTAIFLTEEMLDNYGLAAYHPLVRLEYASVLLESGYPDDAIAEYQFMDTTYARTENGANAAFQLAKYYETRTGDYSKAASYYGKVGAVSSATVAPEAKKRENSLLRILSSRRELIRNDSLVALSDSARKYPENFVKLIPVDSATTVIDSTGAPGDSISQSSSKPQYVVTFKPVDPDSMRTLRAKAAYDLGEIYYTELELADSALVWFQKAWDWKVDSTRAPRTLFILAELKNAKKRASSDEISEMYSTIVTKYPWSNYAHEVRRIQGLEDSKQVVNLVDREYAVAESLMWAGNYDLAISELKEIALENPGTEMAAKSQYALGWLYEYRLSQPDSALYYYRTVSEQHQSSRYASAVKNKLQAAKGGQKNDQSQPTQPEKQGEAQKVLPGQNPTPTVDDNSPTRRRLPAGRGARSDSTRVRERIE